MAFSSDFISCMAPLPAPGQVVDDAGEFVDWLERLHGAWENAGGEEEMTLAALLALGAWAGVDETFVAAVAASAEITVVAYITACAGCLVSAAGSSIWGLISSSSDAYIKDQLTVAANDKGIPQDTAVA
jgi:hypothetical protein